MKEGEAGSVSLWKLIKLEMKKEGPRGVERGISRDIQGLNEKELVICQYRHPFPPYVPSFPKVLCSVLFPGSFSEF